MGSNKHKQLMDAGGVSKLHLAVFQGKQEKLMPWNLVLGDREQFHEYGRGAHRRPAVRKLLERGSLDLNRGDKFGQTPLHIACHKEGLLGCLRLLAAHNADLEALDANGNTALHSAAGSGAVAAAEFLLSRGLSVSVRNNDGHTPIDICAKYCPTPRRKFMLALLEGNLKGENDGVHSADRNPSGVRAVYAGPGGAAPSPGGVSEEQDASSETTALLTGGAGPRPTTPTTNANYTNSKGSKNRQLMYSSSSIGDSPRSKAIAAGAAAARGEQQSMSKTSKAAKVGAASAPLLTPRGGSATMAALSKGEAPGPAAGAGAGPGAGVAPTSHAGGEPVPTPRRRAKQASLQELHLAIFQGDTAKVEEVVGRGDIAALNEADKHGQTPLHLACYKGSRSMTRLLVEGGASLDAVDVNGNGVVHAAVCDSPAVLSILIDSGADVTLPNHDGLTPKKLCEQYCPPRLKERMLQLLRDATASQARTAARKQQLDEGQVECRPTERLPSTTSSRIVSQRSIDAVYHQLAILRSKLAATAAARTEVPPSEAAGTAQTENALLTLVEANVRVVEGQRNALADLDNVAGRLERMFRRLHMRLDSISPGDLSFS